MELQAQQRLSSCSLVCKAWRAAAVAASNDQQQQQQQQLRRDVLLALASLTQLTRLELDEQLLPLAAAAPLGCLQQLQELQLWGPVTSPGTLLRLPPSLTKFETAWAGKLEFSSSMCPNLAALANLQHLDVRVVSGEDEEFPTPIGGLLPDFCSSMQQLRVLKLHGVLSHNALPALARVLPALTRLESLLISNTDGELAPLPACEVASYSALLPLSPHLTHLELSWGHDGAEALGGQDLLHPGCSQHLFAAGRQLPQLKQLVLGVPGNIWDVAGYGDDGTIGAEDYALCVERVTPCLDEVSFHRLVSCCPRLEKLWVAGLVEPGVDMRPLLQLTALRKLCVGGEVVTDDVACGVLCQLTRLRSLGVFQARGFSDRGLLALTGLQQLTRLAIGGCGISHGVSADRDRKRGVQLDRGEHLVLVQQEPLQPVWLQLLCRFLRAASSAALITVMTALP
uniref:F-box domain-containing protein n=1 Tax=Tetradesmus obliquus TaxID=3088 RepID=A0A383WH57_TETOB|eukprot:jgi/Sobl393_1/7263/SZX76469.1